MIQPLHNKESSLSLQLNSNTVEAQVDIKAESFPKPQTVPPKMPLRCKQPSRWVSGVFQSRQQADIWEEKAVTVPSFFLFCNLSCWHTHHIEIYWALFKVLGSSLNELIISSTSHENKYDIKHYFLWQNLLSCETAEISFLVFSFVSPQCHPTFFPFSTPQKPNMNPFDLTVMTLFLPFYHFSLCTQRSVLIHCWSFCRWRDFQPAVRQFT